MICAEATQLAACLDRIAASLEGLRRLNPTEAADREQALAASRQIMGTLALYRGLLQNPEAVSPACHALRPRKAA